MLRVTVGCRVRPLLPGDLGKPVCVTSYCNAETGAATERFLLPQSGAGVTSQKLDGEGRQAELSSLLFCGTKKLSFDHVFFPDDRLPATDPSSAAGVFQTMVMPLIDAVTGHKNRNQKINHSEQQHEDGGHRDHDEEDEEEVDFNLSDTYNATLLLYGQTSAGKTFCLTSLLPMVLSTLVQRCGVEALMFRMVEIYGDNLRDLLNPASNNFNSNQSNNNKKGSQQQQQQQQQQQAAPQLQLRETERGLQMTGATIAVIESEDDAHWLFNEALRRRTSAATAMNSQSSRSHAIFTIFCTKADGRVTKLNLVDLAGSERQKKTGNAGQRMKESVGINKDLLALGNVLRAVASASTSAAVAAALAAASGGGAAAASSSNKHHIPYRQCKLTRLLQDSIGGSAVTAFLACVSPLFFNKDETLRTLQYCAVASAVMNNPVAVMAPPPPQLQQQQQQQEQQQQRQLAQDVSSPPQHDDQRRQDPAASASAVQLESQKQQQEYDCCARCPLLQAALDRSDQHAFSLESKLDELMQHLDAANTDLKKDEKIFVLKFRDNRRQEKENAALRERVAALELQLSAAQALMAHFQRPAAVSAAAAADDAYSRLSPPMKQQPNLHHQLLLRNGSVAPTPSSFIASPNKQFVNDIDDEQEEPQLQQGSGDDDCDEADLAATPRLEAEDALEEFAGEENDGDDDDDDEEDVDRLVTTSNTRTMNTSDLMLIKQQQQREIEMQRNMPWLVTEEQLMMTTNALPCQQRLPVTQQQQQQHLQHAQNPGHEINTGMEAPSAANSNNVTNCGRPNALQERRNNRIIEKEQHKQQQQQSSSGRSASSGGGASGATFTLQDCRAQYNKQQPVPLVGSGRSVGAAAVAPAPAGCMPFSFAGCSGIGGRVPGTANVAQSQAHAQHHINPTTTMMADNNNNNNNNNIDHDATFASSTNSNQANQQLNFDTTSFMNQHQLHASPALVKMAAAAAVVMMKDEGIQTSTQRPKFANIVEL